MVRYVDYLQLILGFALLVAGGKALVRGAISVASRFGVCTTATNSARCVAKKMFGGRLD